MSAAEVCDRLRDYAAANPGEPFPVDLLMEAREFGIDVDTLAETIYASEEEDD